MFVGVFFLLVLLTVVIYYALVVVPPVRTLGKEKKENQNQMVEYVYTNQFAPLLGYRIRPVDFTTEKKLYDMSGNII